MKHSQREKHRIHTQKRELQRKMLKNT